MGPHRRRPHYANFWPSVTRVLAGAGHRQHFGSERARSASKPFQKGEGLRPERREQISNLKSKTNTVSALSIVEIDDGCAEVWSRRSVTRFHSEFGHKACMPSILINGPALRA